MPDATPLQTLLDTLPQCGRVEWIGIRPARGEAMQSLDGVTVSPGKGLEGDRFKGRETSKRQVTLIQKEHLHAIASCLHREAIGPEVFRRNIVVSGLNLHALKGKTFRIGGVILEYTGLCHPCSKMETTLGPGGYNAMRGHGGITTRVVEGGELTLGDLVQALP
ncbi:MOSC domain-containing protein [Marinobacter sp. M216]|uniref:MOSC domain-containing protein n=1 Tax=Marinobacter albus TaxID=3030833 RepID=A0ABT7H980_9GAMM|nr:MULTISPECIES: MOSC domain-containing protein [unclassified Marinobacter]MBW7470846.1 MOSC domain-containing protein [Marinobacter sp. F4218]MDK9556884.1 MOSC domain-containing protein [Marinobacter sp. M216]